ncbi:MAG: type II toxin-antitoxin system YafQ family toxin [Desulfosporosinus sp.]|nr:type II toxin-antitoxin system YafQ family toxin [Desulfosporosinus sp.]
MRSSSRFKRDFKAVIKRGYDVRLLEEVLNLLVQEKTLPQKYLDHPLAGNYTGHRECHITSNWLLIYNFPS